MATNGMTWDQLVAQAQAAQQAAMAEEARGRGESALGQNNFLIDWNGSKAMLNLPTAPTTSWNGEEDPNYDRWANANISFSDPTDNDYGFRLMRNPDGTVAQERYKDVADIGFAGDMMKFAGAAAGMYGITNALAGMGAAAGSSGAGAVGTSAAGAGAPLDFLSSIGVAPESISPFVPATSADFASMGLGDIFGTGAAAASSGGGLAGSAASGGGGQAAAGSDFLSSIGIEPGSISPFTPATPAEMAATGIPGGGMFDWIPAGVKDFAGSKIGSSLIGAGISALGSKNAPNSTTQTSTTQLDPRMQSILYGDGTAGNAGLMGQIIANQNRPQNAGTQQFGTGMDDYLKNWGTDNFYRSQQAAQNLQSSNIAAPTMGAASAQAAQINAPSQNNLDLSSAYNQMIYGDSAQNPYLMGALNKGVNQATAGFQNLVTDATKGTQDLLGQIRGGAVLNNTMGSSRQGIAEGKAMDSFNTQIGRAASQFGQSLSDNILGAQAGAYENGQNRALSAMSGLGAQQYGVAQQNAAMQQQANLANAGFQQQANQSNLQSQLGTNQLNSQNQTAGIGLSSGLLGQAAGYGQQQDQYAGNKLGQTAGLLSPFTGYGATQSQTTPLYQNTAGNILGGALAGAGLWNAFNKS